VGEKTISSFETGNRIGSLKLAQLRRLLAAYGLSEADFFGATIEKEIAPWELDQDQMATVRLLDELHGLPKAAQRTLVSKFPAHWSDARRGCAAGARETCPAISPRREPDWQMLNSRN